MFAMVKCLFLFVWILTSCGSVLFVLMFLGMSTWVNVMLWLMYVSSLFVMPLIFICSMDMLLLVVFGLGCVVCFWVLVRVLFCVLV